MKNAISNVWLLGLVIVFIYVFSGYLAITISYSTAFKMKNEVISIIERHNGMNQGQNVVTQSRTGSGQVTQASAMETINLYLYGMAYKIKGYCPKDGHDWYGASTLVDNYAPSVNYEKANSGRKYYYCFSKSPSDYGSKRPLDTYYYDILIFYKIDLPVLGDIFTFRVMGSTNDIRGTNDSL